LELIVRSDQPENLDGAKMDYLIIDADHCEIQIPQLDPITVLLLTRSKNISELANRYPSAIVLSLPLKKRRFLQSVGVVANVNDGAHAPETVSEADPMLSGLNVLVVDDNIVNRRVCVAQLQKLGVWSISEAEDGRRAITAAQNQAFDIILMDVQMPEIDGLQATQQIRLSLPYTRQPRIVGLTANILSEERERCLGAGMDDELTKPLRIDELKTVLEAAGKIGPTDQRSPASGCDLPVCDEHQLDELLEVGEPDGFVTDVLQLFVDQAEQLVSRLPELADDPEVLAAEAHKLKGAAGYVGAMRAAYYCSLVENTPKSSPSQIDRRTLADLKESLVVSIDVFRKRMARK
jgi:CheY-like chemotaxis protein